MKKLLCAIIPALMLLAPVSLTALDVPVLQGYVNDYGNMISPEAEARIESDLKAFEQSDSTQVVILTVTSLEGDALEDYTIRVAEKWKIGQAKKDNGVIFFASKNDRVMRIEVGRGLEGVLTDLLSGRILDNIVRPRFKAGDFDGGFSEGAAAIIKACRGEFTNDSPPAGESSETGGSPLFMFFFMGILFLSAIVKKFSKPAGSTIGALAMPFMVNFLLFPIGLAGIVISAVAGALLPVIAPKFASGGFMGGGGWSSGGSGGGWSGSDSGGFSGGGGSFGGGGSSGGW